MVLLKQIWPMVLLCAAMLLTSVEDAAFAAEATIYESILRDRNIDASSEGLRTYLQ